MVRLTVINVGYGDALLLENSCGCKVLLDGGSNLPTEFEEDVFRTRSVDYFAKHGITHLDALLISHIHEDHVCGLVPLLQNVAVDAIYSPYPAELFRSGRRLAPKKDAFRSVPLYTDALNDFTSILCEAEQKGIPYRQLKPGDGLLFPGDLRITILGPDPQSLQPYLDDLASAYASDDPDAVTEFLARLDSSSNATSLLIKAEAEGMVFLDAADNVPAHWSSVPAEALRTVNLLKLPHHGQKDAVSEDRMGEMPLQYAITTASSDRRYNSANPEVYRRLTAMAKDRPAPRFLFQDEREYPPYFSQPKGFSAIQIEFINGSSTVTFE